MFAKQMYRLSYKTDSKGRKIRLMRETTQTGEVWYVVINDTPQGTGYSTRQAAKAAAKRY